MKNKLYFSSVISVILLMIAVVLYFGSNNQRNSKYKTTQKLPLTKCSSEVSGKFVDVLKSWRRGKSERGSILLSRMVKSGEAKIVDKGETILKIGKGPAGELLKVKYDNKTYCTARTLIEPVRK